MTDNEYAVTEDDLAGGGDYKARPIADYDGVIIAAESKIGKTAEKIPYLALRILITHGKLKGELFFENYLPLKKKLRKTGKNAGKSMLDFRTARFFQAISLEPGQVPPGAPGGPDAETLVGTAISFRNEHEYQDVPDEQYAIRTGTGEYNKAFLDAQARGALEGIKPQDNIASYSISDDFAGIGGSPELIPDDAKDRGKPKASKPDEGDWAPDESAADDDNWG